MISRPLTAACCAAGAAAVLSTALLAGCRGTGGPAGGQSATTPPAAAPSSPATAATPATSPPAKASPGGSAAAGACATSALAITVDVQQGGAAAGSAYYPINFINTGSVACTLFGYPGVSFVTGKGGSELGAAASRSGGSGGQVTLAPGGGAHAVLQVVDAGNYSASDCRPVTAHWLRVYPPGQTAPGYAAFTAQVCSAKLPAQLGSPLAVYPVRAGKGKMGQTP